jgi:hypothetical protein
MMITIPTATTTTTTTTTANNNNNHTDLDGGIRSYIRIKSCVNIACIIYVRVMCNRRNIIDGQRRGRVRECRLFGRGAERAAKDESEFYAKFAHRRPCKVSVSGEQDKRPCQVIGDRSPDDCSTMVRNARQSSLHAVTYLRGLGTCDWEFCVRREKTIYITYTRIDYS